MLKSSQDHIESALQWLKKAQDTSKDGGVAAWYSLITGWQTSYIETTGYIINTFLEAEKFFNDPEYLARAIKMGDFLVSMQHATGGFRTHVPEVRQDSEPTVFNTGQDIIGLTELYTRTKNKKYLASAIKAADFLVSIQETNGSWLLYTFGNKTHVYHSRVAWSLLLVWKITKVAKYKTAAIKNLDWALTFQQKNGWFQNNELPRPNIQLPYTHTISYAIEGLLWSGIILKNKKYITAAELGSKPILDHYLKHNFVPGTFDHQWQSNDGYTCLTGDSQLALVWLELYRQTNKTEFLLGGKKILKYLRRIQDKGSIFSEIKGSLPGSWPIWGDLLKNTGYCRLAYLNWSTKFYIDALFLEKKIKFKK